MQAGDDVERVADAARGTGVRSVGAVRVAAQQSGRLLVAVRIGLPPGLTLTEVVTAVAHVQVAVAQALGRPADIAVEPSVAADEATPTQAIVIRASE